MYPWEREVFVKMRDIIVNSLCEFIIYSAKIMDSHLLRSLSKGSLESITTYNTWKCMTHRVILRRLGV